MPVHPFEAVHVLALVELHVRVDAPPGAMTDGYTAKVAVGMILTITVAGTLLPPGPVHSNEYGVVAVSTPVL
jgi:hypothetical protein